MKYARTQCDCGYGVSLLPRNVFMFICFEEYSQLQNDASIYLDLNLTSQFQSIATRAIIAAAAPLTVQV